MAEIGFVQRDRYFQHPDSEYLVEFPAGPPTIGEEPVKSIVKKRLPTGVLKVISPTDCVKDRLAAYFHWGDRQALRQAGLVVRRNRDVDLKEIERWSRAEGRLDEYKAIRTTLTAKPNK